MQGKNFLKGKNMKVLFKNKTQYTKQTYQKYLNFHQNKFNLRYRFTTIVIMLLLSFCMIMNFKYKNYPTAFLVFICLLIFIYWQFFHPQKVIDKEIKTDKFENEEFFIFTFYEQYFIITNKSIKQKLKYRHLAKIFETDDFFYLYVNKDHAFLLEKSGFSIGDTTKFLKFLKKKRWNI